jgi:uncharacterized protein
MILHIDQLQASQELCLDVESQQCHLPSNIGTFTAPIHLDALIRKTEERILIDGRISAHITMTCSRCLEQYEEYLEDRFEAVYLPQPAVREKEEEIELDVTDLNVSYYKKDSIEIYELLREQVLLLLPLKPLCKADCAGLCPSCGHNLNEETCDCQKTTADPRFAVLEQLLHTNR